MLSFYKIFLALIFFLFTDIYIVERVRPEYEIEPMGLVRGGKRAHFHISPNLTPG